MKKILFIIVASITLCACDNGRFQPNSLPKPSVEKTDSDSVDSKDLAALQQICRDMKNSIRDNSYRLESVEQSLNESNKALESKVDKQLVYVLLAISLLLLVLVMVSLWEILKLQKSKEKIKDKLIFLENAINRLKDEGATNNRASSRIVYDYQDDINYLKRQIVALKENVNKENVSKGNRTYGPESESKKAPASVNDVKSGYFGFNDDRGIIGKVYTSATEEAFFKYYAKSDSSAEFEPLSVKRIKSISSIRKAITILEGSLQEATELSVVKRGQAVQREQHGQKYWQVIQPAEVKLK